MLALVPAIALSRVFDDAPIPDPSHSGLIPDDDVVGPVAIVNELKQAHSTVTSIMLDHSVGNFAVADDMVFSMTAVDEQNDQIIVMVDPVMLNLGMHLDEGDIEDVIGEGIPIKLQFGATYLEDHADSGQSYIDYWINLYNSRCASPTQNSLCKALAYNLGTVNHYVLDSNNRWQPPSEGTTEPDADPIPEPEAVRVPLTSTYFFDDFENGLGKWTESGESDWRAHLFDESRNPEDHPATNQVAEADNCDTHCTLTVTNAIDISGATNPTLTFWRYVDRSLDDYDDGDGEYLKLEVTKNGRTWTQLDIWTEENGDDDDRWHGESYDLSPYKSDDFKLRFVTSMSTAGEDVGIDDVAIVGEATASTSNDMDSDGILNTVDTCPHQAGISQLNGCPDAKAPVVSVPEDIIERQTSSLGRYVTFTTSATDNVDSSVSTTCSHSNGWFRLGTTNVTCTATDSANNEGRGTFAVTITRSNPAYLDTDGDGFRNGIDNCPTVASDTNNGCPQGLPPLPTTGTLLYGGSLMSISYNITLRDGSQDPRAYLGTSNIGAVGNNGTNGMVVSGHFALTTNDVLNRIENTVPEYGYRLANGTWINVPFDSVGQTLMDGGEPTADAAFIRTAADVSPQRAVQLRNATIINVTGESPSTGMNTTDKVMIVGAFTNDENGVLLFTNATLTMRNVITYTLTHQSIGHYDSQNGDSGAPIIKLNNDGTADIVGVHVGRTCYVNDSSQAAINVQDTQFCRDPLRDQNGNILRDANGNIRYDNDQSYYKIFSSWDNVKASLDLR